MGPTAQKSIEETPHPVIALLPEQKRSCQQRCNYETRSSPIVLQKNTMADNLYGSDIIFERHRHRYEVNLEYLPLLVQNGIVFSGKTQDGLRMKHWNFRERFFFFATQCPP